MKKSKAPEAPRITKAYIADVLKKTDYPVESKDNLEWRLNKYKKYLESGETEDVSDLFRVE